MRIALISDIHGSLLALEAVLADITRQGVDEIICLGDVATLGPHPRTVIAGLQALDCRCVMGNHDAYMFDLSGLYSHTDDPLIVEAVEWCAGRLDQSELNFLRTFQPTIEIQLEAGASLLCFHGSPNSYEDMILAATPDASLDDMLTGHRATVMAGGHTHMQLLRQHGDTTVVTVGSVGAPMDHMPVERVPCILPWADYAIIGWHNGALDLTFRRVPIAFDLIAQTILDSGLPRPQEWLKFWIR